MSDVDHPTSYFHTEYLFHSADLLGHVAMGTQGSEGYRRIMESLDHHALRSPYLFAKDEHGWYAVHIAAMYDNARILKAFVDKGGADLNMKTTAGDTPLTVALTRKCKKVIKYIEGIERQEREDKKKIARYEVEQRIAKHLGSMRAQEAASQPAPLVFPRRTRVLKATSRYGVNGRRIVQRRRRRVEEEEEEGGGEEGAKEEEAAAEAAEAKRRADTGKGGRLELSYVARKSNFRDFYEKDWSAYRNKQGREDMLRWIEKNKWDQYMKSW
jgi:hypothetical protein